MERLYLLGLFEQLITDPRLSLVPTRRWKVLRTLGKVLAVTRAPLYLPQALFWPSAAVSRVERTRAQLPEIKSAVEKAGPAGSIERLTALEQLLLDWMPRIFPRMVPVFVYGLVAHNLAGRLLHGLATTDELQKVLRGLPHNPTTEMDIALWKLAHLIQEDPSTARYLRETPLEQQANDYMTCNMACIPPATIKQVPGPLWTSRSGRNRSRFTQMVRRSTYILSVIANYLQLQDPNMAPDIQFRRGAQAAEAMVADLTQRATHKGRIRGLLVGFLLKRTRALAGFREMPKFCIVYLLACIREQLWYIGEKLALAERLDADADIFFITFPETRAALEGKDMRFTVRERRTVYEHELNRRHIPRVLLSDGTKPANQAVVAKSNDGTLKGTPASAGIVIGKARVILDPANAHLEPGEILIAPSTDPGWTPLFLTAGGLVMEMGGAISHGAVVAREYGIPAVVGVLGATERIITGQQITVDGSNGIVTLEK